MAPVATGIGLLLLVIFGMVPLLLVFYSQIRTTPPTAEPAIVTPQPPMQPMYQQQTPAAAPVYALPPPVTITQPWQPARRVVPETGQSGTTRRSDYYYSADPRNRRVPAPRTPGSADPRLNPTSSPDPHRAPNPREIGRDVDDW